MIKRLYGIAFAGCLLFSFPLLAADSTTAPSLASFLSSDASGAACSASTHKGPDVTPGEQIIICGPCGPDVSCDYHRPYTGCTSFGAQGTCTPTTNMCPQQSNYVECYCQVP